MAASAACLAAGQESDCQAGVVGDLLELPAEVEVLLPEVAMGLSVETPTPLAVLPGVFVRDALVPMEGELVLSGVAGDFPAPLPAPLGLLLWTSLFWPRVVLAAVSVVLPALGRAGSSSPVGWS